MLTLVLLLGAATLYVIHHFDDALTKGVLWGLTGFALKSVLWTLCLVGWTDPGFLPRRDEMEDLASNELNLAYADMYGVSEVRDDLSLHIHLHPPRDRTVYECYTCRCFKPSVSTAHCGDCNRCVVGKDHHCAFLGTCIGIRNRSQFLAFLVACIFACSLSFSILVSDFVKTVNRMDTGVSDFSPAEIGLLAAFAILVLLRVFVFPFLLSYSANLEVLGFVFLFGFVPLIEMVRQDHIPWMSSVPAYLELMVLFFVGSNLYYQVKLLRAGSTIREMINNGGRDLSSEGDESEALIDTTRSVTVIPALTVWEVVKFTLRGFWLSRYPKYMK